jgi:phage FluMu protein Com
VIEKFDRRPRGLKAPMCQKCAEPKIWYRSTLSETETGLISHFFQCPKCRDIQEISSKARAGTSDRAKQ